jgi:hypothetical protein
MMKGLMHVGFSSDWPIIVPVTGMNFGIKKINFIFDKSAVTSNYSIAFSRPNLTLNLTKAQYKESFYIAFSR